MKLRNEYNSIQSPSVTFGWYYRRRIAWLSHSEAASLPRRSYRMEDMNTEHNTVVKHSNIPSNTYYEEWKVDRRTKCTYPTYLIHRRNWMTHDQAIRTYKSCSTGFGKEYYTSVNPIVSYTAYRSRRRKWWSHEQALYTPRNIKVKLPIHRQPKKSPSLVQRILNRISK